MSSPRSKLRVATPAESRSTSEVVNVGPLPLPRSRSVILPVPSELQLYWAPLVNRQMPTRAARRDIIERRMKANIDPPKKSLTEAEIDALYGLEPALDGKVDAESTSADKSSPTELVVVNCPYCGEAFETSADASAGMCSYVEDCQIC